MTSKEQCCDDRFEIINETKQYIINATNIETSPEEMNVLDSICFRLWQLGLTKRNKDKLTELKNILEEYNVTPEILREVLLTGQMFRNQPTLSECIKEWEENYGVLQNDEYYLEVIDEWNVRILIDKKTKRYQCYSVSDDIRRLETPMLVEIDAHNLLSKTIKALEAKENDKN